MSAPAPPSPSLSDRLRYAFDNSLARGTIALIGSFGEALFAAEAPRCRAAPDRPTYALSIVGGPGLA